MFYNWVNEIYLWTSRIKLSFKFLIRQELSKMSRSRVDLNASKISNLNEIEAYAE